MVMEKYPQFSRTVNTYLNAHSVEVELLKRTVEQNPKKRWVLEFRTEFRAFLDDGVFSRLEYERLTDSEFETDDECRDWLACLYSHLFEGGPSPEGLLHEFLLVPNFDPEDLKRTIKKDQDQPWPAQFKSHFDFVIKTRTIDREYFEQTTGDAYAREEDIQEWLRSVWTYLFEDGPSPS